MPMEEQPQEQSFWRSPVGIVCAGFLIVGGFFLLTEHTAPFFGVLPWLLMLACQLMHLFMHHGHGQSGGSDRQSEDKQ
jgi:DUF2933 family protein